MKAFVFSAAALVAACTVNGKPFSLGGSSPGGGMSSGGGSSGGDSSGGGASDGAGDSAQVDSANPQWPVGSPPGACRAPAKFRIADQPPFVDRPADPWMGVRDGRLVPVPNAGNNNLRSGGLRCDAQHDHCLRDCTWFVTYGKVATPMQFRGGESGKEWYLTSPLEEGAREFVAYRTVPVTRGNVKVGSVAVGRVDGEAIPPGELEAHQDWAHGQVESIDWAGGTLRLAGHRDPFFLTGARVAVLEYHPGGKVEVIVGADAKAPSSDQLFLPTAKRGGFEDPWKQVDGNGQPRASTELGPMVTFDQDCSSKFNHCLRPSAWMLETTLNIRVVHWNGSAWVDPADHGPLDDPGKAYRTRPAQRSEAKVGAFVIAYRNGNSPPRSEADAYAEGDWFAGKIASIDGDVVTLAGVDGSFFIDNLRVPLVWWFPGEKAEKVE